MISQHQQVEIQANAFAPTRTPPEEMQQFRGLVEALFNPLWLSGDEGHRLQRLWARKDELAQLELAALGYAIEALQDHPRWLADTARLIRNQPVASHGFLCEIMTLGSVDVVDAQLRPMGKNAAGYDGEITLADGHVLRASVKNHDLSSHEAAFRTNSLAFAGVVRNEAWGSGDAWRVILYSVAPMQASSIQGLTDQLKAVGMSNGRPYMLTEAEAGLQIDPIRDPSVLPSSY